MNGSEVSIVAVRGSGALQCTQSVVAGFVCHRRVRTWKIRWSDIAARSTSPGFLVNLVKVVGGTGE